MRNIKDKKAFWVRLICGILVLLMVLSSAYAAIMTFFLDVSADESIRDYKINADTIANIYVAVGVEYAEDARQSPLMQTDRGFAIGEANITGTVRNFNPHIMLDGVTSIAISPLTFLSMKNGRYLPESDKSRASVLPFRVEITSPNKDVWEYKAQIEELVPSAKDLFSVKGFTNGKKVLKYGGYPDAASASTAAGEFEALLTSVAALNVSVYIPSGNAICMYDPADGSILFEYDTMDNTTSPAIVPLKPTVGNAETLLENENKYRDVILFSRYGDKINTMNLVELNTYVQGVLPSEIYSSWNLEVQKAFAIIVRSLTVGFLCRAKHFNTYNFDVCDDTCCQAYRGRSRTTETTDLAVNETGYQVMTINGVIATAYYSAVNGGESILMNHAWGGGNQPYIISQKTPWEKYTTYIKDRGFWFFEYTPTELKDLLRSNGYEDVTKPIAKVEVTERAGNTNYVYSTTYTDTAGNTQIINRTSKNYGAIKVRSANYNIGIGSVDYFLDTVLDTTVKRSSGSSNPLVSIFNVATDKGIFTTSSSGAGVLTTYGPFTIPDSALHIITDKGISVLEAAAFNATEPDANGKYTAVNVYGDTIITTLLQREHKTYTASSPENIVIAGKGWGHGIGLSQYGANDLAKAGAEVDQIIRAYFDGIEIMTVRQLRGLE